VFSQAKPSNMNWWNYSLGPPGKEGLRSDGATTTGQLALPEERNEFAEEGSHISNQVITLQAVTRNVNPEFGPARFGIIREGQGANSVPVEVTPWRDGKNNERMASGWCTRRPP
jgi:hypothetical protein